MTTSVKASVRNTMVGDLAAAFDAGSGPAKIAIYAGTRPVNADTAMSGTTKLVEFTLSDPSWAAPSAGAITLNGTPLVATAVATGTATFFRAVDSAGNVVCDGSVGTSSADLILVTTSIVNGATVVITAGTITMPA